MTPQHFSTDPMLTSTIESRQLATMGEYIVIQYNSTTVHNTQYTPTIVGLLACIVSIGLFFYFWGAKNFDPRNYLVPKNLYL